MDSDYDRVRTVIVDALRSVLGDEPDIPIGDDTTPIGDLGLASADGVDFSLELEERLKCTIDNKVNPLVDDERHQARTVKEIVVWIMRPESVKPEDPTHE